MHRPGPNPHCPDAGDRQRHARTMYIHALDLYMAGQNLCFALYIESETHGHTAPVLFS